MANLSPTEFLKYDYRAKVFVKKIQKKEKFKLVNGQSVVLKDFPGQEKILLSKNKELLKKLKIPDTNGAFYSLSKFEKTSEFGGKGARGGTIKEDAALSSINEQIEKVKNEIGSAWIPIKVKNEIYKAAKMVSTPGTPKSDFHLIDIDGNEIAWFSHKDGTTPKHFSQWGGTSKRSEPRIFSHPETQQFIKDCISLFPNGIPNRTTVAREIKDNVLKMQSIFGNEYGSKFGRQNVTAGLQGNLKLIKKGNVYEIDAFHVYPNGTNIVGGYEPVFTAIYKGDRSDHGLIGGRITIYPKDGRRVNEWI